MLIGGRCESRLREGTHGLRLRGQRHDSLSGQLCQSGSNAVLLLSRAALRCAVVDLLLGSLLTIAHQLVFLGQVSDLPLQAIYLALHGSVTITFIKDVDKINNAVKYSRHGFLGLIATRVFALLGLGQLSVCRLQLCLDGTQLLVPPREAGAQGLRTLVDPFEALNLLV